MYVQISGVCQWQPVFCTDGGLVFKRIRRAGKLSLSVKNTVQEFCAGITGGSVRYETEAQGFRFRKVAAEIVYMRGAGRHVIAGAEASRALPQDFLRLGISAENLMTE